MVSKIQGHSAAGRIMSKKNFIDTIEIQTRGLPAWCAVPQSTVMVCEHFVTCWA